MSRSTSGEGAGRRRLVLVLLCGASFLAVIDTTIVNIGLPSIRHALGMRVSGSQWVLNSYALVFGGMLLLSGRLGDRWGRRRLFVLGLVGLAAGSVLAGAANGTEMLIVGRIVQGIAAAAFVPNSLSLLTATFTHPDARSRALGMYGATAGLGFVAGMIGGGMITQLLGWRWIFWINLPVIALVLTLTGLASELLAGEFRGDRITAPADVAGAITVTVGLLLIIVALGAIPHHRWLSLQVLGAGAAGIAALIAFGLIERRHPAPLVPPTAVTHPAVVVPQVAISIQSMVGVAWLFLLTLYLQDERGQSALESGLWFAPMTVASVSAAAVAGRLIIRFGRRISAVTGQLVLIIGVVIITIAVAHPAGFPAVIIGMVVGEAGFMLANVAVTVAAMRSLDDTHAGLAAGLVNTSTQLGGALGLAVVATLSGTRNQPTEAVQLGFDACTIFGLGALAVLTRLEARRLAS